MNITIHDIKRYDVTKTFLKYPFSFSGNHFKSREKVVKNMIDD